jgi:uncharacterized OsmC-like protein
MVELVWNSERSATALTSSGTLTEVGSPGAFVPEDLVCMAAASCLMRTFLALAKNVSLSILSYASTARVQSASAAARPRVFVNVYIAVSTSVDASVAHRLCRASADASTVAQLLGDRLTVACDVRVVSGTAAIVH